MSLLKDLASWLGTIAEATCYLWSVGESGQRPTAHPRPLDRPVPWSLMG